MLQLRGNKKASRLEAEGKRQGQKAKHTGKKDGRATRSNLGEQKKITLLGARVELAALAL